MKIIMRSRMICVDEMCVNVYKVITVERPKRGGQGTYANQQSGAAPHQFKEPT